MQNKLIKIANDTNSFLKRFIKNQKKTKLVSVMNYGLFPGGKKIRSKIIIDIGYLFKIDYKTLMVTTALDCLSLIRLLRPGGTHFRRYLTLHCTRHVR